MELQNPVSLISVRRETESRILGVNKNGVTKSRIFDVNKNGVTESRIFDVNKKGYIYTEFRVFDVNKKEVTESRFFDVNNKGDTEYRIFDVNKKGDTGSHTLYVNTDEARSRILDRNSHFMLWLFEDSNIICIRKTQKL